MLFFRDPTSKKSPNLLEGRHCCAEFEPSRILKSAGNAAPDVQKVPLSWGLSKSAEANFPLDAKSSELSVIRAKMSNGTDMDVVEYLMRGQPETIPRTRLVLLRLAGVFLLGTTRKPAVEYGAKAGYSTWKPLVRACGPEAVRARVILETESSRELVEATVAHSLRWNIAENPRFANEVMLTGLGSRPHGLTASTLPDVERIVAGLPEPLEPARPKSRVARKRKREKDPHGNGLDDVQLVEPW